MELTLVPHISLVFLKEDTKVQSLPSLKAGKMNWQRLNEKIWVMEKNEFVLVLLDSAFIAFIIILIPLIKTEKVYSKKLPGDYSGLTLMKSELGFKD